MQAKTYSYALDGSTILSKAVVTMEIISHVNDGKASYSIVHHFFSAGC
jgi:hypothetical protein